MRKKGLMITMYVLFILLATAILFLAYIVTATILDNRIDIPSEDYNDNTAAIIEDDILGYLTSKYGGTFKVISLDDTSVPFYTSSYNAKVLAVDTGIEFHYTPQMDDYGFVFYKDEIQKDIEDYVTAIADNLSMLKYYGIYSFDTVDVYSPLGENLFLMTPEERRQIVMNQGLRLIVMPTHDALYDQFKSEIIEFVKTIEPTYVTTLVDLDGNRRFNMIYEDTSYNAGDWVLNWLELDE